MVLQLFNPISLAALVEFKADLLLHLRFHVTPKAFIVE